MTIQDFLQKHNLSNSLLIGYYGGGNYGDELLLEILQNLLSRHGAQHVAIAYQRPDEFGVLHDDFGYQPFNVRSKTELLRHTFASRHVIVGGGGLWGVDMNLNTLQMSVYLWLCRWLLRKKVYLVGVGFYNSTSRMGRVAAWLAGKAANAIFARDDETCRNFSRLAKRGHVHLDSDLAWYARDLDLERYRPAARQLGEELGIRGKTFFLSIRRPQAQHQRVDFTRFSNLIESCIADNQHTPIIIAQLELARLDPQGTARLKSWADAYENIKLLNKPVNPLVLYTMFREFKHQLALIGPQFHIILTAYLNHVPFLPISYDNKVRALLQNLEIAGEQQLSIAKVELTDMQHFIDSQTNS